MEYLPPALADIIAGSELDCDLQKFVCVDCDCYLNEVIQMDQWPSCAFRVQCSSHSFQHVYVCSKHSVTFTLRKNLRRHILRSRCGDDNDDDECISWPNNINEDEDDDDDAPSLPDAGLTDAGLIVDNEHNEPPDDPPGDRKVDRIFISPAGDCFHASEQCPRHRGRKLIAKRSCGFCNKRVQ